MTKNADTSIPDPRPDITSDAALWTRLLAFAAQNYRALIDPLLAMHQGGTVLKRLENGRSSACGNNGTHTYALRPLIGKRGWPDEAAYKAKAAELLRPHHDQLIELLQNFAKQMDAALKQGTQGNRIRAHMDIRGYCAIKSGVLDGEVVYFARDGEAAACVPRIPENPAVYTLDELRALVDSPPGDEGLRKLHFAKKTFSGTILHGEG